MVIFHSYVKLPEGTVAKSKGWIFLSLSVFCDCYLLWWCLCLWNSLRVRLLLLDTTPKKQFGWTNPVSPWLQIGHKRRHLAIPPGSQSWQWEIHPKWRSHWENHLWMNGFPVSRLIPGGCIGVYYIYNMCICISYFLQKLIWNRRPNKSNDQALWMHVCGMFISFQAPCLAMDISMAKIEMCLCLVEVGKTWKTNIYDGREPHCSRP